MISKLIGQARTDHKEFFKYIQSRAPLRVLDIGCRVPLNLFVFYHVFDCEILQGVDVDPEIGCVKKHAEYYIKSTCSETLLTAKSFYDVYRTIINPEAQEKPLITDEAAFNQIFISHFVQSRVERFVSSTSNRFDVIIASNILHLIRPPSMVTQVLENLKRILLPGGIIIIRVQDKPGFIYKDLVMDLDRIFPEGELYECSRKKQWHHSIFINEPNLLNS